MTTINLTPGEALDTLIAGNRVEFKRPHDKIWTLIPKDWNSFSYRKCDHDIQHRLAETVPVLKVGSKYRTYDGAIVKVVYHSTNGLFLVVRTGLESDREYWVTEEGASKLGGPFSEQSIDFSQGEIE